MNHLVAISRNFFTIGIKKYSSLVKSINAFSKLPYFYIIFSNILTLLNGNEK